MDWLDDKLALLLPGLAPPRLAAVRALARATSFGKGESLLAAGARWRDLWLVESGALRLYYLDAEGAESNKNFFLEGQACWPITPVLRDAPVGFHVAAIEPARVHALDHAQLSALLADEPAWLALQLRALQGLLEDKLWREQMFLQCDAQGRYLQLLERRPQWSDRIPLRHLASWLGMSDVSLSRLRAGMGLARGRAGS